MKRDYLFLIVFILIYFTQNIFSQDNTENLIGAIKIVYAKISYERNVIAYKIGNGRVYPAQKIPVEKRSYRGTFRVQLTGNDFVIKEPLSIRCHLSNGDVLVRVLKSNLGYFYPNEVYEVTFDFNTDEVLYGETKIELLKTYFMSPRENSSEITILDTTNIYVQ
jgi:hypothetical protein